MKRFWKQAGHNAHDDGRRAIELDGRPVRTPGRAALAVPTSQLADAIAAEWNAVEEDIDPAAMPFTGLANAAIDRIGPDRATFVRDIAGYANSDLLCYRADYPAALATRQAAAWDPILDWALAGHGAHFHLVEGIVHRDQPEESRAAIERAIAAKSDFELAALSKLTTLSGSVLAALALADGAFPADTIWQASIVDELWQEEQWGDDDSALQVRAARAVDFMTAARFLELCAAH